MNKKTFAIIVVIVGVIIMVLIGLFLENNKNNLGSSDSDSENKNVSERKSDKVAIIYFSATGTTENISKYIKDVTGGDLIKIVPVTEYTGSDLDYNNDNSRANREQNDELARPEIKNKIDVSKYDIIYLGYPIWWGNVPKIILTFLDNYDLSGKTVIPFCTSGGSSISASMSTLKEYKKGINWIEGKRFSSNSKEEIAKWAVWK